MIKATATRRTTLNGKTYEKGEPVPMSSGQFEELKPIGRFERESAESQPAAVSSVKTSETKPSGPAD